MAYSFQSITSGAMLTSTFVNKIETNIVEHWHGIYSITNQYGGVWTSVVTNASTAIAHKFDTTETFVASGSRLLSIQNSGTEKFGILPDGSFASTKIRVINTGVLSLAPAGSRFAVNTIIYDTLAEWNLSTHEFTPVNTGYYALMLTTTIDVTSDNFLFQAFPAYPVSPGYEYTSVQVSSGFQQTVQAFMIQEINPSVNFRWRFSHNAGGNIITTSGTAIDIYRVV